MEQRSIRFDRELAKRLRQVARSERLSLPKAALLLMRRGAGLIESKQATASVGVALDAFIGRWSAADERRLLDSIAACEATLDAHFAEIDGLAGSKPQE